MIQEHVLFHTAQDQRSVEILKLFLHSASSTFCCIVIIIDRGQLLGIISTQNVLYFSHSEPPA